MGKRVDREGPIHIAILGYLRQVLPDAEIHHSAGESHIKGRGAMLATVKKKRMGMVPGWPDLTVFPFSTLGPFFLEVKAEGGRVEKTQAECHARLRRLGYRVAVVRSIDDVRETLQGWNIATIENTANIPMRGSING